MSEGIQEQILQIDGGIKVSFVGKIVSSRRDVTLGRRQYRHNSGIP